ncbi:MULTISPECIES: sarcosine oxidase subunit gamma [Mesorhizobium]|uniref:Sarcosine oxidase subunit gamma n=4 Tax=Mesorhizobium TaxID=68287 RepID=A0ABZ0VMS8_9HYPH|nr:MULTISPECIES: sarcosine oxidase subunit gamma [Mesorhizobium]MBZ9909406.1 sarcosine oxidase subunit gamma [Mesorhizobium sp. BR115XR7A]QGX81571.1 sarcosine oxidase subunit gamma [Mesorhizobium japonicum R7A]QJF04806.1 sarcosine oxidase subunit gamma [Mesorhizobium japonicum R7A]QJF10875.1 sarcosine oxidase subunit gamma [Mesorhizobium japonicum]QJI86748.1 sarcosine oxidase subunit gamma [Mesorhizobium japonicum]
MANLRPLKALGAENPRYASFAALEIRENLDLALASLALRRKTVAPQPFGLNLPRPGRWVADQEVAAFWTGPGQWMVEAEGRAEEDFAADLKEAARGCSVTEQTGGWVAVEILSRAGTGPLDALLAKLINIDLAGFGPGRATRTVLDHMTCFVIRRSETHVAVLGARSFGASLWHALEIASRRIE